MINSKPGVTSSARCFLWETVTKKHNMTLLVLHSLVDFQSISISWGGNENWKVLLLQVGAFKTDWFIYVAYLTTVKTQRPRRNDEINSLCKSTTSDGRDAPLLKRSQWNERSCGGRNKTAAHTAVTETCPVESRGKVLRAGHTETFKNDCLSPVSCRDMSSVSQHKLV